MQQLQRFCKDRESANSVTLCRVFRHSPSIRVDDVCAPETSEYTVVTVPLMYYHSIHFLFTWDFRPSDVQWLDLDAQCTWLALRDPL